LENLLANCIQRHCPQNDTLPKIVFSKTLDKVEWQYTRLVEENVIEEITYLKHQLGKTW
jgi:hypothetical protein